MDYKIADITKDDLYNADEAFFTGSASEVTPIRKIDDHEFSNGLAGELTLKIQSLYYDIVRGEKSKYDSWLSYVK
jgi:branched-chain amino acid aminotransferase